MVDLGGCFVFCLIECVVLSVRVFLGMLSELGFSLCLIIE